MTTLQERLRGPTMGDWKLQREAAARLDQLEAALGEWSAKTEWVQDAAANGTLKAGWLGMHRADVMTKIIAECEVLLSKALGTALPEAPHD